MNKLPILHDVLIECPECHRVVHARRVIYPDRIYFTCNPHRHKWDIPNERGVRIEGNLEIKPPRIDEEDE